MAPPRFYRVDGTDAQLVFDLLDVFQAERVDMMFYEVAVGTTKRIPTESRDETFDVMNYTCICHGSYTCPQFDSGMTGMSLSSLFF